MYVMLYQKRKLTSNDIYIFHDIQAQTLAEANTINNTSALQSYFCFHSNECTLVYVSNV